MKLQGTLRRTLAMLLVLIFALSNMGLAEVAEQVAESLPAAEPSVEEPVAEEVAPAEADEEEGDVADIPVEEDSAEPEAPAEGEADADDTADAEFEVEDAAPVAKSVSVEVQAIDVDALCAYETIEPEGDYDVSYKWERAESVEGEWTELEETSDVLKSDAEDRAEYVYRCIVSVGDVTATSEPATFNWGAEAAPIDLGADFGLTELGTAPTGTVELKDGEGTKDAGGTAVIIDGSTEKGSLKLTATQQSSQDAASFKWTIDGGAEDASAFVSISHEGSTGTKNEKATISIKPTAISSGEIKADGKKTVKIECVAVSAEGEAQESGDSITITLLPAFDSAVQNSIGVQFVADEKAVTEAAQKSSSDDGNKDVTAKITGISPMYGVAWAVADKEEFTPAVTNVVGDWVEIDKDTGVLTIKNKGTNNTFDSEKSADGQVIAVKASVGPDDAKKDVIGKLTVRPEANKVALKVNGKDFADAAVYPACVPITIEAVLSNTGAPGVKCYNEAVKWTVQKGGSDVENATKTATTYTFTPGKAQATSGDTYTLEAKYGSVTSGNSNNTIIVKNPGSKFEAEKGIDSITFIKGSTTPQSLTLDLGGTASDPDYAVVEWKVVGNTNKWTQARDKQYLDADSTESVTLGADGVFSKEDGSLNGVLKVKLHEDVNDASAQDFIPTKTASGDTPVEIEATGWYLKNDTTAEKKTVTFKVNVLNAGTTQPANSAITITSAEGLVENNKLFLGQPDSDMETDVTSDKYPAWATATATMDMTGFEGYKVKWTAVESGAEDWVSVDKDTGVIKVLKADNSINNDFGETGKEITIKGTVLNKADGTGDTTIAPTAKIYILPESVDGVKFSYKQATNSFLDISGTHSLGDEYTKSYDVSIPRTNKTNNNYKQFKLALAPVNTTPAFGKITSVKIQKLVAASVETQPLEDVALPDAQGLVDITSKIATDSDNYKLVATTTTGKSYALYITLQDAADELRLTPERNVMYVFTDKKDTMSLTVDPYLGGKKNGTDGLNIFTDGLDWTLGSVTGSRISSNEGVDMVSKPVSQAETDNISLVTGADAKTVTLTIPKNYTTQDSDTSKPLKFKVTVTEPATGATASAEFELKTIPTLPDGVQNLNSAINFTTASGSEVFVGTGGLRIPQGDSYTAKLKNYKKEDSTTVDVESALAGYDLIWSVTGTSPAEWIEASTDASVGTIHAFAEKEKKNDAQQTPRTNVLDGEQLNTGVTFNVTVKVAGLETEGNGKFIGTKQITVVAAPADILFTDKDRGETSAKDIPMSLAVGNSLELSAKIVGPAKGSSYAITIEDLPILAQDPTTTAYATLSRAKKTDKPNEDADYWTLTAKAAGLVKITTEPRTGLKKTLEILITNEQDIKPSTEATETCLGPNRDGQDASPDGQHHWVLVTDNAHKPSAAGHIYQCTYCKKYSEAHPHTSYKVVGKTNPETKQPYSEAEVLESYIKGGASNKGSIVCEVCGWECAHTNYTVSRTNGFVDSNYHTGTCADCGKSFKAAHRPDNNGLCQDCGRASITVKLANASKAYAVVNGAKFIPTLKVSGTTNWEVTYAVKSGDESYISVEDGAVTAKAVKSGGGTATVIANVTANGDTVPFEFTVNLRTKPASFTVAASQTDASGKAYIIRGQQAVKLTATPGQASDDLRDYYWAVKDSGVTGIEFYADKDGKINESKKLTSNAEKNVSTIWVKAAKDSDNETNLDAVIEYKKDEVKDNSVTPAVTETFVPGSITIDVLKGLTLSDSGSDANGTCTELSAAIAFGDEVSKGASYRLIEGDSVGVSLKDFSTTDPTTKKPVAFDTRYGDVVFSVKTKSENGVNEGDRSQWINITGSGKTVASKAGMLATKSLKTIDFTVVATLSVKTEDGKVKKYDGERDISIVTAPEQINVEYKLNDDTKKAVPDTGIEVYERDVIELSAAIGGNHDTTIDASALTWDWSGLTGNATLAKDASGNATTPYTLTIAVGASDFSVSVGCFGKTQTVNFKVKKIASRIDVTSSETAIGVGEAKILEGGAKDPNITVKISAAAYPEDAEDSFTFTVADKNGRTVDLKLQDVPGEPNSKTFTIATEPDTTRFGSELTITATAAKAGTVTDAGTYDATTKLTGKTTIHLYKKPDSNAAFLLETEQALKPDDSKLHITAGASTEITKHCYDESAGYGSLMGIQIDPVIYSNQVKDATGALVDGDAIRLDHTGDEWSIEAVAPGTAKIRVFGYTYDTDNKSGPCQELTVVVEDKVDDKIEIDAEELKKEHIVSVGTQNALELLSNKFTVWRTNATNGTRSKVDATEYDLALVPSNDKLNVEKTNDGWKLTGVSAGESGVKAVLGTAQSDVIPVTVEAAPEAVLFKAADGTIYKTGEQIELKKGDTTPFELTAITDPEDSFGELQVDPTTGDSAKVEISGTKITVTPTGATGTTTITAKILNTKWSGVKDVPNDPQWIKGHIDIVLPGEAEVEKPKVETAEIIGKSAIGPGESTTVRAIGVDDGAVVKWSVDSANSTGTVVTPIADGISATVTGGTTPGVVILQAKVGETLVGEARIEVLTPLKVTKTDVNIVLAKNETLRFEPEFDGYDSITEDGYENVEGYGLFTYAYGDTKTSKYLTLSTDELIYDSGCVLTGKSGGSKASSNCLIKATSYDGQVINIHVNVTAANKGFTLSGYENTTQVMAPGKTLTIPVKFNPTKALVMLDAWAEPLNSGEEAEGVTAVADGVNKTVTVTANADAEPGLYEIYVSRQSDGLSQSFYVDVRDEVTAQDEVKLVVDKINGFRATAENQEPGTSINVVKNEQLQAYLVDAATGEPYSGVTWSLGNKKKSQKLTLTKSDGLFTAKATGKDTIVATYPGGSKSFEVNVGKQPTAKLQFVPSTANRTVALDEDFELAPKAFTCNSDGTWMRIEWTGDDEIEAVQEDAETKPTIWSFAQGSGYESGKIYHKTATLVTSWGKTSKPVKFTIQGEYSNGAPALSDVSLPVTGTTILRAEFDDDYYASLKWAVEGKELTLNKSTTIIRNKLTVKQLDNSTLQITTKKASGASVSIEVWCEADPTDKNDCTATVNDATVLPSEASIVLPKNVIGMNEKITATMEYTGDVNGQLSFSQQATSGKSKVKITNVNSEGATITGSKPGEVTITAMIDKQAVATAKVYVVPKATVTYSQKPTKMAVGEKLTIGVAIGGYDKAKNTSVPATYTVDTKGIVTASSVAIGDTDMIRVVDVQPDEPGTDGVVRRWNVTLEAIAQKLSSKGKATATTVKIAPQMGAKLSAKITVVRDEEIDYYPELGDCPEDIYIGVGETISMPVVNFLGTTIAANLDWTFEDSANAAAYGLTMTNGKLKADKTLSKSAIGKTLEMIGSTDADGADEPLTVQTNLHIGAKITGKTQFTLIVPKDKVGLTEPMKAYVDFGEPASYASGKVTFKSSKSSIAAINKTTGLITGKKVSSTKASITATAGGKKSSAVKLQVVNDPTGVRFAHDELKVTPTDTKYLWDEVELLGGTAVKANRQYMKYESAFSFEVFANDDELLEDVDERTGELKFNPSVTSGVAHVRVTTYNGFTDEIVVVMGNGGSASVEPERVPATIELRMNDELLSNNTATNPIEMTDADGNALKLTAIVKDSEGVAFVPNAGITWGPSGDEHVSIVPGDGLTATLTALKSTMTVENKHQPVEITASVAKPAGGTVTASFYVQIDAVLRKENVELYVSPSALLTGGDATAGTATVTLQPTVGGLSLADKNLRLEVSTTTKDLIEISEDDDPLDLKFKIKSNTANKYGEANVHVKVYDDNGTKGEANKIDDKLLFEIDQPVGVNALPLSSKIHILSGGVDVTGGTTPVVLAVGEPCDYEIQIDDFTGTPANGDIEVHLYPIANDVADTNEAGSGKWSDAKTQVNGAAGTDELKRTLATKGGSDQLEIGQYKVVVKTYPSKHTRDTTTSDKGQAEFTIEIKTKATATQIKVETSPAVDAADKKTITLGVGESATLKATLDTTGTGAGIWNKGLVWTNNAEGTGADTTLEALVKAGKIGITTDGDTVTVTATKELTAPDLTKLGSSANPKLTFTVALKDDNESTVNQVFEIVVLPQPTDDTKDGITVKVTPDAVAQNTNASGAIILGEKEKVTATVDFSANQNVYTNSLSWKATSTDVTVQPSADGKSAVVTGAKSSGGITTVQVYSGSVVLGSANFQVYPAPATADIVLKEAGATGAVTGNLVTTYDPDASFDVVKYVAVSMTKDTSATFKLTSSNDHLKVEDIKANTKNAWKISWYKEGKDALETGTDTIALYLTCTELSFRKNYNLTVTGGQVQIEIEGTDGVSEPVEAATPKIEVTKDPSLLESKDLRNVPTGFGKDLAGGDTSEPGKPTAEGYVTNQTTVEESIQPGSDGKSMTITLSANVDQLHVWDATQGPKTPGHWYLIVLDTGVSETDWTNSTYTIAVVGDGKTPGSGTESDYDLSADDVNDAKAFNLDVAVGVPLWINMDQLLNGGKLYPIQLYIKTKSAKWNTVTEPYMTFNIVGGTVTGTAA